MARFILPLLAAYSIKETQAVAYHSQDTMDRRNYAISFNTTFTNPNITFFPVMADCWLHCSFPCVSFRYSREDGKCQTVTCERLSFKKGQDYAFVHVLSGTKTSINETGIDHIVNVSSNCLAYHVVENVTGMGSILYEQKTPGNNVYFYSTFFLDPLPGISSEVVGKMAAFRPKEKHYSERLCEDSKCTANLCRMPVGDGHRLRLDELDINCAFSSTGASFVNNGRVIGIVGRYKCCESSVLINEYQQEGRFYYGPEPASGYQPTGMHFYLW